MESAFGVDHGDYGEIEKFNPLSAVAGAGRALSGAGGKAMVSGARKIKTNPGMGKMGHLQVKAGGALRSLGQGIQRNPGMSSAIGGAGAVGAGGIGAGLYGSRRRQ